MNEKGSITLEALASALCMFTAACLCALVLWKGVSARWENHRSFTKARQSLRGKGIFPPSPATATFPRPTFPRRNR